MINNSRWTGIYHVVDRTTLYSLESHHTKEAADRAAQWCNDHEATNGRLADRYRVEVHSEDYRRPR